MTIKDPKTPSERTGLLSGGKSQDEDDLNFTAAALAFAMLVQSYLLVSVFPYSGFMAMFLIPGVTEETAGSYAGLIASSFMAGRTFSSFEWGKIADVYGRVFVIKTSLLLSAVFSILFGLATSFHMALFWRFVLGLCNGLMGPIKTVVSEVAHGDQKKETRLMALVIGMWGYGFLINPAIGGYLSDPLKQYPDAEIMKGLEPALRSHPFLLPNVVGCLLCLIAYALVGCLVEETLPVEKLQAFSLKTFTSRYCRCCCPRKHPELLRRISSWGLFKHLHYTDGELSEDIFDVDQRGDSLPKWLSPSPSTSSLVIMARSPTADPSSSTSHYHERSSELVTLQESDEEKPATIMSLWNRKSTREHLILYWIYSFLVICMDEMFPLYCISRESGLGIQEKLIGNIMTSTGVCYIALQYLLLTRLVDTFGLYNALKIGAFLSIPLCCFIPISLMTNKGAPEGQLNCSSLVFLGVTYGITRALSSVTFSTLTMATNRTVPAHHRATMNGFSMLGGSLSKAAGPAFAGFLYSFSVFHISPPFGSVVAYSIIALMGLGMGIKTIFLKVPENTD